MSNKSALTGTVRGDSSGKCTLSGEYEVGDRVYVDYGDSGKLGPGKVSAKVFFEVEGETPWLGYEVTFKVSPVREISHSWYDENVLRPA